jgi:hypothetical protein
MEREMILRVLLAVLAIWGMTWASNAHAARMVEVCGTKEVSNCQYSGGSYSCNVEIVPDYSNCWWEDWGYGDGGGDGGDSPTPPGGGGGGGGSYATCTNIRSERPLNCGDQDPGNPGDFPDASEAISQFSGLTINITSTTPNWELAITQLHRCIGGGHGSVQSCASEGFLQIGPGCDSQLCRELMDDLAIVMGTDFIGSLDPDSFNFSFAYPPQIGIAPDFDDFPEWMKTLITLAQAQMDCHVWHQKMNTAGCNP